VSRVDVALISAEIWGAKARSSAESGAIVRAVSSSVTAGTGPSRVPSRVNFALCAASILVLLGLFLVPAVAPALLRAEHWAADWRTAFLSDRLPGPHARIAIIPVTEDSLTGLPYILPINRGYLADLVAAVDQAGALVIGLDFYFARDTEARFDEKLLATLAASRAKVVLGAFEDASRPTQLANQLRFIASSGAAAGYIDLMPDADHVVRYRARPPGTHARYRDSFSTVLARAAGWTGTAPPDRISWLLPPADGRATFEEVAAQQFLSAGPEQRAALVKDRIVIVGGKLFSLDRHWTPLSLRTGEGMSGVDIHAHMAAELVDNNRSYAELDRTRAQIFLAMLAALAIVLGARFQTRGFDFLNWRVASFLVIALDLVVFRYLHLMLPFTLAAVAWIAGVTAGSQLRRAVDWARAQWLGGA
jgi:adenylate cyclase